MKNISFAKDMSAWNKTALIEKKSNEKLLDVIKEKETYSIDNQKDICNNLLEQLNEIYKNFPNKELGDAKIHLSQVKNCLDKINNN